MGAVLCKESEPAEKDAKVLHKAMKGCCTNEDAIIKVAAHRNNNERQAIKQKFMALYHKDLIDEFKSKLKGHFKECCTALFLNPSRYDAQWLHKAMSGMRTNDSVLIEIMCTRTKSQIRDIIEYYRSEFHRDLKDDLKSKTSGDLKKLLTTLCENDREETIEVDYDRAAKDAEQLYKAGEKRWGTDEHKFIEIISGRSIHHLRATFDEYHKISKHDILQSIDREMSGNIRDGLKAVVMSMQNSGEYFAEKLYRSMKGLGTDVGTVIRVIVSRSEVDLQEIKAAFSSKYKKTLAIYVSEYTSGDYRRLLEQIIARES